MKKMYLFILVVLLLPVTSFSATKALPPGPGPGDIMLPCVPVPATGQEVHVPYVTVTNSGGKRWFTGIVITNLGGTTINGFVEGYTSGGSYEYGSTWSLPAYHQAVQPVEYYFGGMMPAETMQLWVRSEGDAVFSVVVVVAYGDGFSMVDLGKSTVWNYLACP
jgi:hypothetical protein